LALFVIAVLQGFARVLIIFLGWTLYGRIGYQIFVLLKPATYMNESGRAVAEALRFYKLGVEALTVLHDELDLAPFKVKARVGGGLAGHNGLRSIDQHLGPDFRRVRIGIGHPGHKDRVVPWVLGRASKDDDVLIGHAIDDAIDVLPLAVRGDYSEAMKRLHTPK
jgi:PTH1 family peptidyl-tRNA hydrolase